jgi:hypothetical protein
LAGPAPLPLAALPGCEVVGEVALRFGPVIEVSRGGKALLLLFAMLSSCLLTLLLPLSCAPTESARIAVTTEDERECERERWRVSRSEIPLAMSLASSSGVLILLLPLSVSSASSESESERAARWRAIRPGMSSSASMARCLVQRARPS